MVQSVPPALFFITQRPVELQTAFLQGLLGCLQGLRALQEQVPLLRQCLVQHCRERVQAVPA